MSNTQLQLPGERWSRSNDGAAHTIAARATARPHVARAPDGERRDPPSDGAHPPGTDLNACYDLRSCLKDRFARRCQLGL